MKPRSTITTLAAIVVCCLGLGITAGLLGMNAGSGTATPTSATMVQQPLIGDYGAAQRELERHLAQRLELHLAQASRRSAR